MRKARSPQSERTAASSSTPQSFSIAGGSSKRLATVFCLNFRVQWMRFAVRSTQRGMAKRNASTHRDRRIDFRIGVNVGDIVIEGDDILGDGVNIAARLEGIAEPGGIAISDDTYRQVRDKLDVIFDDTGEQTLKNITRPVRVYRVRLEVAAQTPSPTLTVPDKPSIAVLPFQNMSGDPEQEYFADGVVEDIITALSRIRWLFVIARNSSFTYKGRAVDVKQVGRELGAPRARGQRAQGSEPGARNWAAH